MRNTRKKVSRASLVKILPRTAQRLIATRYLESLVVKADGSLRNPDRMMLDFGAIYGEESSKRYLDN